MYKLWKHALIAILVLRVSIQLVQAQHGGLKTTEAARNLLSVRGEVIVRFVKPDNMDISRLASGMSIDQFRNDTITAYLNEADYSEFLKLGISYEIVSPPSMNSRLLTLKAKESADWRTQYPAYHDYVDLMNRFASQYPQLCRLVEFGLSAEGRKLLALKITDFPDMYEKEPVVFYSSTMHGDEPLGFVLLLRLIDYLCSNYPNDNYVKELVNRTEIWINPLANPDGTYFVSDSSIMGATRFNRKGIDLNRDFPDIRNNWEVVTRQPETMAMMQFMEEIRPALSANLHGGAEVVNYPWDTWSFTHPDDTWFRFISRSFADTVHIYGPEGYMTFLDNGITNGNEWYSVYGGRQDYINYILSGREVTLELSNNKIPDEEELDNFWNYTKRSLLQYIGQVLTGVTGQITDSMSGRALKAQVRIPNHDFDHSYVFSAPENGTYFRLLGEGEYAIHFAAPGYLYRNTVVQVNQGQLTTVDVRLSKESLHPNPFTNILYFYVPYAGYELNIAFVDVSGRQVKNISLPVTDSGMQQITVSDLAPGYYIIQLTYDQQIWKLSGIKN
jgi:hypothetical protein